MYVSGLRHLYERMTKFPLLVLILIRLLRPTGAFPRTGLDCDDGLEYQSGSICCLNCPAGTRKASPCTRSGQEGKCEECDDGTYIEHGNGLSQCFKCTQCRSDEEIVRPCTHVQDARCQCKPGRFCAPDQACEVCKKCSRCEKDEEIVRNCTSTTNTECKKKQLGSASASANALTIGLSLPLAVFIIGVIIFAVWRCLRTESVRNPPDRRKAGKHDGDYCPTDDGETQSCLNLSRTLVRAASSAGASDECKALRESPGSSASNSQLSLTGLPSSAFPAPPPRAVPMQPDRREDVEFPTLVAVNGEESLRKCFEYFEEIDYNHYKRFFRHLGIVNNVITSKDDLLPYEDRIHDLLTIWVEKEGREATINDLLRALLLLNQRRTAETVKEKAVLNGHYSVER